MDLFEDIALHTAPSRPRLWKRYVDDTSCIVKKGEVDKFLQHLNGIRPSIKFTVEVEEGGKLPFLDTLLKRKDDGSLDITVYRKPTHNFQSHHPVHVKRGLVRCLYDRAKNIVCSQDGLRKEQQHLAAVLGNNGYPAGFIGRSSKPTTRVVDNGEAAREPVATAVIPYYVGMSEDIRRICRGHNMTPPPPIGLGPLFDNGSCCQSMVRHLWRHS